MRSDADNRAGAAASNGGFHRPVDEDVTAWHEDGGDLAWEGLGHLRTSEVGEVLECLVRRIERHLRRCGLLGIDEDETEPGGEGDPEGNLAASAVSGQTPPAGPCM
jgi:hypothetical protein